MSGPSQSMHRLVGERLKYDSYFEVKTNYQVDKDSSRNSNAIRHGSIFRSLG